MTKSTTEIHNYIEANEFEFEWAHKMNANLPIYIKSNQTQSFRNYMTTEEIKINSITNYVKYTNKHFC